jgi:spermidine/putrescine-binding protein
MVKMLMMNGSTGIFVDPRKLPRTKQPPASTATLVSEKALPEYRFRRLALYRSCLAVILVDLEAVRLQTNTTRKITEAAEQASLWVM